MFDDMRVLRDAVADYQAAARAAGLAWPEQAEPPRRPAPDLVRRMFDLPEVPEQLVWLLSRNWSNQRVLPGGGWIESWPTEATAGQVLDQLAWLFGSPVHWRAQMPLFNFEHLVFTLALTGAHAGEVWRFEITPDVGGAVRAAPSLAALFGSWTTAIRAGVIGYDDTNRWLEVGDGVRNPVDSLRDGVPDLDIFAFPVYPDEDLLRERQQQCGVDMAAIERGFDAFEELQETVDATRAELGLRL